MVRIDGFADREVMARGRRAGAELGSVDQRERARLIEARQGVTRGMGIWETPPGSRARLGAGLFRRERLYFRRLPWNSPQMGPFPGLPLGHYSAL